ncbi:MAG: hypothetical protein NVS3B21_30270 [Acidimicrobiales bacterium]
MAIEDASGLVLEANAALCAFLGYSATELATMNFRQFTHPDDLAGSERELEQFAQGASSDFVLEKRYITATGSTVWGRVTGIAVRGGGGELLRLVVQIEDITEQRVVGAALIRRESFDELTGLVNRRRFYETLRASLADRRRSTRQLAVLVVNVNRFHQLNAGMGQAAADLVLCEVGRRLTAVTRGRDTVGRLGGDEFAVIAAEVASVEEAIALAVKIHSSLAEPYLIAGNSVFVSGRVGIATAPGDGTEAETLIARAIAASTVAKALAGGWATHTDGADAASADELGMVSDLRSAIRAGELTVAYQPIVDGDGRLHCFEALARWSHPTRGPVPPNQFIVLAEQNDLIASLSSLIIHASLRQAAEWGTASTPVRVAVNLSGKLLGHPLLVDGFARALAAADLTPDALTIEITETALAEGGSATIRSSLEGLRSTGIRISIDDFGTGYSSLSYLKTLPVDELKIDRSFITDLESDDRSEQIVRSIVDLAHSLKLAVVAEGVEDDTTAHHLLRLGVDYLQGFGIARPVAAAPTTAWLRNHVSPSVPTKAAAVGCRSMNVLVVDDDIVIRSILRKRLDTRGHRVSQADSGPAAVEAVKEALPDLIVLDHHLPGLSGVETTPLLREAGYGGPIVLFTAATSDEIGAIKFPIDLWPVSKDDTETLMRLVDGYARVAQAGAHDVAPVAE